jgi:hypothetical protein
MAEVEFSVEEVELAVEEMELAVEEVELAAEEMELAAEEVETAVDEVEPTVMDADGDVASEGRLAFDSWFRQGAILWKIWNGASDSFADTTKCKQAVQRIAGAELL